MIAGLQTIVLCNPLSVNRSGFFIIMIGEGMKIIAKIKKWIVLALVLLAVSFTVYVSKNKINFPKSVDFNTAGIEKREKKKPNLLSKSKVVLTEIQMRIGKNYYVGIELATPYNCSTQQSQLNKFSNMIKNDFLFSVDEKQMAAWVKQKNYYAVKKAFLDIVNKYVDKQINSVYISHFFVEEHG